MSPLTSVYLWNYSLYAFLIILTALGLWLAHKNNDRYIKPVLVLNFLVVLIFDLDYGSWIPYLYFLFCLIRWVYRKFTTKKNPSSVSS